MAARRTGGRAALACRRRRADDVGRRFWVFVSTLPLTCLTLASLYFAPGASGPAGSWWLTAAWVALAERLATFAYFVPAMVGLMKYRIPRRLWLARGGGRRSTTCATRWCSPRGSRPFAPWRWVSGGGTG